MQSKYRGLTNSKIRRKAWETREQSKFFFCLASSCKTLMILRWIWVNEQGNMSRKGSIYSPSDLGESPELWSRVLHVLGWKCGSNTCFCELAMIWQNNTKLAARNLYCGPQLSWPSYLAYAQFSSWSQWFWSCMHRMSGKSYLDSHSGTFHAI
jgi:hypothetical protein